MSVYGIGSYYEEDLSKEFYKEGIIAIGWEQDEKKYYHGAFKTIENGDIILMKTVSRNKQKIIVRGIGIVKDNETNEHEKYGSCIKVEWLDYDQDGLMENELSGDGGIQRGTTIYKEFNKDYINEVIEHIKKIVQE